jgi:hypothetical protein
MYRLHCHKSFWNVPIVHTEKSTTIRLGQQNGAICSKPCGTITSQISFRLKQPNINVIIKRIKKERFRRG